MRKSIGKFGEAIVSPFLRAVPLFLPLFAAFFLAVPDTANAQVWVASSITSTSATCSTSAIDSFGQPSPAATDYKQFSVFCAVNPSDGSAPITSAQCPFLSAANDNSSGIPLVEPIDNSNPTATCSISYTAQPGVTYTVFSVHLLSFNPD
jgi:hypothetical protein